MGSGVDGCDGNTESLDSTTVRLELGGAGGLRLCLRVGFLDNRPAASSTL